MSRVPKLIASDLDGTLLLNGAQKLEDGTCALIRRLQEEKGILFFAASGRQYYSLQRLFAPIRNEIGYICENGSISYVGGKRLHQELMQEDLAKEIISAVLEQDGLEVLASGEKACYVQPKTEGFFSHMQYTVGNRTVELKDILNFPEPYMKVSLFERGGLTRIPYWQERFGGRATVQTGGGEWLDLMPPGVNKGTALRRVLQELDIAPEDCMAFGDNDNDIEMLSLAGCPITMENAKEAVFPLGKYHTDTVEHALLRILEGEGYDW